MNLSKYQTVTTVHIFHLSPLNLISFESEEKACKLAGSKDPYYNAHLVCAEKAESIIKSFEPALNKLARKYAPCFKDLDSVFFGLDRKSFKDIALSYFVYKAIRDDACLNSEQACKDFATAHIDGFLPAMQSNEFCDEYLKVFNAL